MKNNEGQLILFLSVAATAQNAGAEDADEKADAENNGHGLIWILTHGLVGGSGAGNSLVFALETPARSSSCPSFTTTFKSSIN